MIKVDVAYATPEKQIIKTTSVLPNATIEDAIRESKVIEDFPEIDMSNINVGIFSRRAELTTRLKPGDRVEIYRPLTLDPKEARRLRAKAKSK